MVTSDFRPKVEIRPFRAWAMHPAIIIGTVRSLWTWLWGRYHVPQNVFLVTFKLHHWKCKFSNTASSFMVWSIFFSNLFENDTDQFLFANLDKLNSSLHGPGPYTCRKTSIKTLVDFLLVLIELFLLGVTAEALRACIDWKSAISLHRGSVWPKTSFKRGRPPLTILLVTKLG